MNASQAPNQTQTHTLPDGRILAYCVYGDPNGQPVFYAHGGPGSRLEGALFHQAATRFGFRLIAVDRPGMGLSTFQPGRRLLDYPTDLVQLADALQIERFGVLGWSSGGTHTTVCAYAIPERLNFNITLAGYTNFAELPGAADMLESQADRTAVRLAQRGSPLFGLFFTLMRWSVRLFPEVYYREVVHMVSETDRQILADPEIKAHFITDQQEAAVQKAKGLARDAAIHYMDWGFRLREIEFPLHIFHGTEDHNVPVAFSRHIAANVPDCSLHILEGQGHFFPIDHQDLIFQTAQAAGIQ